MSLNSVNTNINAQVALQSLNITSSQLAATQKQISTGFRVAGATDDGAAYAIAQRVRSDVAGLTSANQQLGNANGIVQVTLTGLNSVSNTLQSIDAVLVKLGDGNLSTSQRSEYTSQINVAFNDVKNFLGDATYNGKSLIGGVAGGTAKGFTTIRNEVGGSYAVSSLGKVFAASVGGATGFYTSLAALGTSTVTSTAAKGFLGTQGTFTRLVNDVGAALNYYGSVSNYISTQISYNSDKIDSLNAGLGSLIDADLAKESAQLTALQIRQQLGTQALSIANQSPQSLLSLFK